MCLALTMFLKSAPPTPTMTMDSGSLDAATILSTVSAMSVISPSWKRKHQMSHDDEGENDSFESFKGIYI